MRASPSLSQLWQPHSRLCQLCRVCEQQRSCSPGFCRKELHATEGAVEVRRARRRNRGTRPTSPQTVPRLATMTGTHPAPSAVSPSLSGVKSPTRSSVAASSNLRRARRTSTALSVACSSLRLKPGVKLLCCSHALHSWHSLLCGCHSCDSDGLALTGPQSLVLRLV